MSWQAHELHCVNRQHNKFYRIIQSNGQVVVRFGPRGSSGQVIFKQLDEDAATEFVSNQIREKLYKKGYSEVFTDYEPGGLGPWGSPQPATLTDIEEALMARWKVLATSGLTGTPRYWAVFSNLLLLSKVDLSARFALDALQSPTHLVDPARDLVIASVNSPKVFRQSMVPVSDLGAILESDTTDILQTALGLYQPDSPDPSKFLAVARRLGSMATTNI